MNKRALLVSSVALAASAAWGVKPTASEMKLAHDWAVSRFGDAGRGPAATPPFSFLYGDRPFLETLNGWRLTSKSRRLDGKRVERTIVYTDPATRLTVTCRAVEWRDYPVVEWTIDFKNGGQSDTPIISDIRPMDVTLTRDDGGEFVLHHNTGDNAALDSYAPHSDTLGPGADFKTASAGGRPTTGPGYPYWNVKMPGGGVIAVLSWGGQWSAEFSRDSGRDLRIRAGQELTHFALHPGEEASSPLAVLQFYQGATIRSQNIWRRWMIADNAPRIRGKLPLPFLDGNSNGFFPNLVDTVADEKQFVDAFAKAKVGTNFWDLDAGWYPVPQTKSWWEVGTWEPDPVRFPKGVKELSDFMHARGIKLVLWFEPERVYAGTWLAKNHPEWIYGGANGGLLKLGEPDCWKWIVDRVSDLITSQGVDVYRQDFNIDPLGYWRANDAPDRQGITEIRHVEGYKAFWEELKRRHPDLIIDTCASGGRRNTLETLRQAIPLLRSDDQMAPIDEQCHTYGLSPWVPINGTGVYLGSDYAVRSCMAPIFAIAADVRQPVDWDSMRKDVRQWQELWPLMLGDFYPLTPYSMDKKDWIAWQWDSPEAGKGMVQAFRRDEAAANSIVLKLSGVEASVKYKVTDLDSGESTTRTGKELMDGLSVKIALKPGAALIEYERAKGP